jgi:aspartyl protease family protein
MSAAQPGQLAGRIMWLLAWVAALLLATWFFGNWEEARRNPNQTPESVRGADYVEVRLASNPQGHYLLNGQINGRTVTLLLDTGATQVAIPRALATRLGLVPGAPMLVVTASGRTTAHSTRLDSLQLGEIRLTDVPALIVPDMPGDDVLLGMSALKHLEFTQRAGTLVLRQTP